MPNTGDWKAFERKVAAMLNTRRTPLSGMMSGHGTHSDTLHKDIYVECKWGKANATLTLWEDTVKKAKAEGKLPLLAMHRRGSQVEFGAIPLLLVTDLLAIFLGLDPVAAGDLRCCKCNNPMAHKTHPVRDKWRIVQCGGHAFDKT